MDDADALPEDDLAALITAINMLLPRVGLDHGDLELAGVTYETGIPEELILALFRDEPIEPSQLDLSFPERLAFLRDTRRAPKGEPFSDAEIANKIGVSRGMVWALFSGRRNPGLNVAVALEELFDTEPGFLTVSGRRALARALRPIYTSLVTLSGLRGEGITHLALRTYIDVPDKGLGTKLQAALVEALTQASRDPVDADERELREIAAQVRALDPTPRGRLMGKIRGLLKQP